MSAVALRLLLIVCVSFAGGAVHATLRGLPWAPDLKQVELRKERKDAVRGQHQELRSTVGITLDEFKAAMSNGTIIIDARPASEFAKGHLAIDSVPPVLNIEPQTVDQNLTRLMQLVGQPIVLYCTSDHCELAEELYVALKPHGFEDMKIFFPGWEGIEKAGLPTRTGADTWQGFDQSNAANEEDPQPK